MNTIARRLLGAAAAAVARKLLPDAVPEENPGSALALPPQQRPRDVRSELLHAETVELGPPVARPTAIYAPPPAPAQPVYAPPPPRRRRVVTITETIFIERDGGIYD